MRGKKLLATAVAGGLVMAQMAMPVMADGGGFDIDVSTKTGVIRVEVPTSMAVAVNQFMISDTGSQIKSEEFTMVNKSEMPVKVTVTSTATLGTGVDLVATREKAGKAGEKGAWMAVAAATSESGGTYSYDDASTDSKTEALADLSEKNANVTAFDTNKKAEQAFYLKEGSGAQTAKGFVPETAGKAGDATYTKFFELTKLDSLTGGSEDDEIKALAEDVYSVVSLVTDINGETLSLFDKENGTYAGSNTYYKAAATETAESNLDTSKEYVYVEMASADAKGKAAFRYIGELGTGRETWTDTEISKIGIAYTIAGVTTTKYGEVESDLTYGLYTKGIETCELQTIVSGTGTNITSALTADKGVYIKAGGKHLTTEAAKLGEITLNGKKITPATTGNSSGNGNAVYFKFPSGTSLKANDVITVVVDGTTYTFTVAS